jgi:hypothetical protein
MAVHLKAKVALEGKLPRWGLSHQTLEDVVGLLYLCGRCRFYFLHSMRDEIKL